MSVNKAIIIGRLGKDPELRQTHSGTAVCSFSVATTEKWKDKRGEWQDKTEWHNVVVWDRQGETCAQYLSKGREVYVEGRIQTRKWQGKDGNDRYTTEIVAQNVRFLGGKGDQRNDSRGDGYQRDNQRGGQANNGWGKPQFKDELEDPRTGFNAEDDFDDGEVPF